MSKTEKVLSHTFDVQNLPPAARARYITVGNRYGSDSTLRQADKTLKAFDDHPEIAEYGFGADDAVRLRSVRSQLENAGATRESVKHGAKITRTDQLDAIQHAKSTIAIARAVLHGCAQALATSSDAGAASTRSEIVTALDETAGESHDDVAVLGRRLTTLSNCLAKPAVATAAHNRGGPKCVRRLADAQREIATVSATVPHGTPTETEAMNLLDGIIVADARTARKAARAAARDLGAPAIAKAFELSEIHSGGNKSVSGGGAGGAGGAAKSSG